MMKDKDGMKFDTSHGIFFRNFFLEDIDFEDDPYGRGMVEENFAEISCVYFAYKMGDKNIDTSSVDSFLAALDPMVASFLNRKLFSLKSFEKLKEIYYSKIDISRDALAEQLAKTPDESLYVFEETPFGLLKLSSLILNINRDEIFADFCCGKGGALRFFYNSSLMASCFGIENDQNYAAIAKMQCEVLGDNIEIISKSVFDQNLFGERDIKFDKIFSDIPLLTTRAAGLDQNLVRADWEFYKKIMEYLKEGGKCILLATNSTMGDMKFFRESRREFVEKKYIEAVIELNEELRVSSRFAGRYPKRFIIILSKNNNLNIKFIDATQCSSPDLDDDVLADNVFDIYNSSDEKTGVKTVSVEEVRENDYSLLPSKYINYIKKVPGCKKIKFADMVQSMTRGTWLSSDEINALKSETRTIYKYLTSSDIDDGIVSVVSGIPVGLGSLNEIPQDQEKFCILAGSTYIVVSKIANPLKIAAVSIEVGKILVSGNLYLINLKKEYDPYFVMAYLKSYEESIERLAYGERIKGLYKNDLMNLDVYVPSEEKQREMAKKFKENEESIRMTKYHLTKLNIERKNIFFDVLERPQGDTDDSSESGSTN